MDHKQALETKALERYLLNEMRAAERDAFEEHYFSCRECASDLVTAAKFLDNAKPVLVEDYPAVRVPAAAGARGGWEWPAWMLALWSRPVLAGACAAMALFIGVRETTVRPVTEVTASYFLAATRTEPKAITIAPGQKKVGIRLERTKLEVSEYEFTMPGARDFEPVRYSASPGVEEMQLSVPVSALREGPNTLLVKNAAGGAIVAEVVFEVKFQ
jgi:hypothetical protein